MSHNHNIADSDTRFIIDPITRIIRNQASKKTTLMQNDHNSERFTFELPRYVEGHDMSLCNAVEIHYSEIRIAAKNYVMEKTTAAVCANVLIFNK